MPEGTVLEINPQEMSDAATVARLAVDQATARRIADALAESLDPEEAVSAAVAEPDGSWAVEITFGTPPDEASVRALVALVAGEDLAGELHFVPLRQRDWVASSLAGLAPVCAGRFIVHGAHSRRLVAANRIGIEIEAALAFGTGHHGSTRGCLLALDLIAKGYERAVPFRPARPRHARRVLDLGTGSGVLAIAAARALRLPVLASDLDRLAVRTARQNARLNRVGGLVEVISASGLAAQRFRDRGPFDLIFANILLRPLQQLAAPLARLAAPGARIVLSGLLPGQASAALASYRAEGLVLQSRLLVENWATLVLVRPRGWYEP